MVVSTEPDRPVRSVDELVARAAAAVPDTRALVASGGRELTWAGLEGEVARVATGLSEAGVVAGYRVALVMANRVELVTGYLGTLRARAVACPLDPRSTATDLRRAVAAYGARMVLVDRGAATVVREAVAGLQDPAPRVVVLGGGSAGTEWTWEQLVAPASRPVPGEPDPESLAVLLPTSGASGEPRTAMLSHRALLASLDQVAAVDPPMVRPGDTVLGLLPLFHVYGLNAVLGAVLRSRAALVLEERFDPIGTLDLVARSACTVLPVAPPVLTHWLGLDPDRVRGALRSVRVLVSGAAPLSSEIASRFTGVTGMTVHQGYGLTEAASVVTSTLASADPAPGSVGAALPGVELRIVDEDGRPAVAGDPGEIEVRGAHLFSGYWPDGPDGPDGDGWWRTGDIGILDARGDLTLVDRVRDLVVVSGFHVYPAEVEEALREVEGVADAAVVGVPDRATGEAVVGYVRSGLPQTSYGALAAAAVEHCRRRLAGFKQPHRIEVVEDFPRGATGRVQKGRLRAMARGRPPGAAR
jgi:long-chain acyl-CoA synthetase